MVGGSGRREGGREGGREREREGGREGGREGVAMSNRMRGLKGKYARDIT